MGAEKEEHNRHAEQKLLRRGILVTVVDLLPHIQVIIGTGIELERNAPHPVEHDEGSEHVADVGKGPRCFLRDSGDNVVEDLQCRNQDKVNCPRAWMVFFQSVYRAPEAHPQRWQTNSPLAFTQFAFRFGSAAWSLVCSMDSAGSW